MDGSGNSVEGDKQSTTAEKVLIRTAVSFSDPETGQVTE